MVRCHKNWWYDKFLENRFGKKESLFKRLFFLLSCFILGDSFQSLSRDIPGAGMTLGVRGWKNL